MDSTRVCFVGQEDRQSTAHPFASTPARLRTTVQHGNYLLGRVCETGRPCSDLQRSLAISTYPVGGRQLGSRSALFSIGGRCLVSHTGSATSVVYRYPPATRLQYNLMQHRSCIHRDGCVHPSSGTVSPGETGDIVDTRAG